MSVPAKPVLLPTTLITNRSAILNWAESEGALSYKMFLEVEAAGSWTTPPFYSHYNDRLLGGLTSFIVWGLAEYGWSYRYRIKAINFDGESDYSDWGYFQTRFNDVDLNSLSGRVIWSHTNDFNREGSPQTYQDWGKTSPANTPASPVTLWVGKQGFPDFFSVLDSPSFAPEIYKHPRTFVDFDSGVPSSMEASMSIKTKALTLLVVEEVDPSYTGFLATLWGEDNDSFIAYTRDASTDGFVVRSKGSESSLFRTHFDKADHENTFILYDQYIGVKVLVYENGKFRSWRNGLYLGEIEKEFDENLARFVLGAKEVDTPLISPSTGKVGEIMLFNRAMGEEEIHLFIGKMMSVWDSPFLLQRDPQLENPPAPILGVFETGFKSFIARWEEVEGCKYYIDISKSPTFASFEVQDLDVGFALEYKATGLDALFDSYYFRVRAENLTGVGANSVAKKVTLKIPEVEGISFSDVGLDTFKVSWDAVEDVSDYDLRVAVWDISAGGFVDITGYDPKAVTGTSHTITGLEQDTIYFVWVRGRHNTDVGEYHHSGFAVSTEGTVFNDEFLLWDPVEEKVSFETVGLPPPTIGSTFSTEGAGERTVMETGRERLRSIRTWTRETVRLGWEFTDEELEVFLGFWRDQLLMGERILTVDLPDEGDIQTYEVRFLSPQITASYRDRSVLQWVVSAEVEVLKKAHFSEGGAGGWETYVNFSVSIDSRSASFSLDGYEEFSGYESTPPRFYMKKEFSGEAVENLYSGGGCSFGVDIYDGCNVWEIEKTTVDWGNNDWDAVTITQWGGNSGYNGGEPGDKDYYIAEYYVAGDGDLDFGNGYLNEFVFEKKVTATTLKLQGTKSCKLNYGDSNQYGDKFLLEELVEESKPEIEFLDAVDSETWAFDRNWGIGDAGAESTIIWAGAGTPRDWSGTQERWEMTLTDLEVGNRYAVEWFSSVGGWTRQEFEAESATKTFSSEVGVGEVVGDWKALFLGAGKPSGEIHGSFVKFK